MQKLYSLEAAAGWKKKAGCYGYLMLGTGVLALGVCIFLCTLADGRNTAQLLLPVVIISTLAGWAVMLAGAYLWQPARARAEHMKGILSGKEEKYTGVLQRTGDSYSIPKSVTVKKVALVNGEERTLLHADSAVARLLPPDGERVRVTAVRKFITGYEVMK